ncbi:leucine-rich repeat domain-containing protein [Pseudoalteromonas sp. NJ631]|uniref:leucine-rich repeat domain-containing protein n=1 Tax=Pseudoalteromonas sp. NJ631 TaxID=493915 RepID=UPI0002FE47D4|nr:leucine-rich repeat domain-containing protein [Pseudoalteromonas sp. NJ631]
MIKNTIYKGIVASLLTSTLAACGGSGSDKSDTPVASTNKAPVIATIAPITAMERDSITAVATVTDEDGPIETLLWEQTAGTTVELTNNTSETLEFRAPDINEATTLTFKLTATDDKGASSSQELTVNLSAYAPLSSLTISDAALAQCLSDTHQDVGISIVECVDYPVATLAGLSGISGLSTVSIKNAELNNLDELAQISTLTVLKLDNAFAAAENSSNNDAHLEQISKLNTLESLSIVEAQESDNYSKRLDFSLLDLSGFEQLHTLEIDNYSDQYETIQLSELPSDKLTRLTLRSLSIDDKSTLKRFSNLQSLSLTHINDLDSLSFLSAIPNLTALTLDTIEAADSTAIEAKTHLTTLVLSRTQIEDFSFLEKFSELEKLGLSTYHSNVEFDIADISGNTKLTSLSLNNLTVDNVSKLSTFTELQSLSLERLNLSSLRFLQMMPKLTSLKLNQLRSVNDLGWLSFTPNLTELYIREMDNSTDFSALSELENMRDLTVYNDYSNFALDTLSKMQELETLNLEVSLFEASNEATLPNLKTLNVKSNRYSNMVNLTNFPALESAELLKEYHYSNETKITTLDSLGVNTSLKSLKFSGFTELEDIAHVSQFENLETLFINYSQAADISEVASLTKLKSLTLKNFSTFFRADMLASLNTLERLEIKSSAIYCDDEELLKSLDGVTTSISNYNCIMKPVDLSLITDEAFKQCIEKRGYQDAVRDTSLSCDGSAIESLNGITQFEAIKALTLSGSVNSALLRDPSLAQLHTLKSLDVYSLTGALTAKATLPQSLTSFELNTNSQTVYDFALFGLPTTLTYLDLDSTKLTNYGSLKDYAELTRLELNYTNISDLSPLFNLTNLKYLSLYGNPNIDCAQVSKLKESLPNIWNISNSCN